eukprot:gene24568-53712_t
MTRRARRRQAATSALLCAVCAPRRCSGGGHLVGPGKRDTVGFFVAGSSAEGLNGLYAKVEDKDYSSARMSHITPLLYQNDRTGWLLAYVDAKQEGRVGHGGKTTEWTFTDHEWRDRFAHEGDTYLPGCCRRW